MTTDEIKKLLDSIDLPPIDYSGYDPNILFARLAPPIVRQLLAENERLTKALEKIASNESWDEGRQTIAIKTLRGE